MPAYAGFESLGDYLTRRCADRRLSYNELSDQLGFTHTYIASIASAAFSPSRARADAIARFFGDPPRLVRILAGLELPPTEEDEIVSAIREVAAGLTPSKKRELLRYANYLARGGDGR